MPLVHHVDVIEELPPEGADHPLDIRRLPGVGMIARYRRGLIQPVGYPSPRFILVNAISVDDRNAALQWDRSHVNRPVTT